MMLLAVSILVPGMRDSCILLGITNLMYQVYNDIHFMKLKPFNTLMMRTTTLHLHLIVSPVLQPISRALEINPMHQIYHNPQRERILNVELHLSLAIPRQPANTTRVRLRDGEMIKVVRIKE